MKAWVRAMGQVNITPGKRSRLAHSIKAKFRSSLICYFILARKQKQNRTANIAFGGCFKPYNVKVNRFAFQQYSNKQRI